VPQTYVLESVQFQSGTNMTPVATVRLTTDTGSYEEAATGDGPVDAVYHALERIAQVPLTLEAYEIRSVGSGKDALGEVTVRVSSEGRSVHGRGLSTDVVEASALAYVDVLNKLAAGVARQHAARRHAVTIALPSRATPCGGVGWRSTTPPCATAPRGSASASRATTRSPSRCVSTPSRSIWSRGLARLEPARRAFFERMRDVELSHARLAAFGSTRRKDTLVEDDANLAALLAARTPVVTLFGKSWTLHVREALGASLDENLAMIASSVAYVRDQGRRVVYDAEHYFDGFADDPDYALATLVAAAEAGAERLVLCDTNGGRLPEEIATATRRAREHLAAPVPRCRSASIPTTTPGWPSPTPWRRCARARRTCRGRSAATASAAATSTCSACCRRWSSSSAPTSRNR
jgi:hypothetical protein